MSQSNGARKDNGGPVILGRELRLRITPQHKTSLDVLAKRHGWPSPTTFAEALLADAIEEKSRNTVRAHVLQVLTNAIQTARFG